MRLAGLVAGRDPATPVPTCPGWTIRDLVGHVGAGHRWVAGLVEARQRELPPRTEVPAPDDPAAWPEWLTAGARRLVDAVRATGPELPVWTWQADRTAGFWLRRMLHDELVHRYWLEHSRF